MEDEEDYEYICGESYDHTERKTYEDDDVEQWECTDCGAEWYHDKEV